LAKNVFAFVFELGGGNETHWYMWLAGLLACASQQPPFGRKQLLLKSSGTVKDQTAPFCRASRFTATQTATGAKRTAVSNETGSYVLASLPLGPYMLGSGLCRAFKAYVQTGIVLQVNANPTINVVLQVGQ